MYIIFDRYFDKSIKSDTRLQRIGNFKRSHQLSIETSIPSKELCMSSFKTKENLIEIITKFLLQQFSTANCQHKLIVTSKSIYPVETSHGLQIKRQGLMTMLDEADYIIPQHVNTAIEQGHAAVKVISADTDVFVLLCGMYVKKNWTAAEVDMEDFNPDKPLISIQRTIVRNRDLVPSLIPLHALTGCDTVPILYGIGKTKAFAVLKKHPLKYVGDASADIEDVKVEGRSLIA